MEPINKVPPDLQDQMQQVQNTITLEEVIKLAKHYKVKCIRAGELYVELFEEKQLLAELPKFEDTGLGEPNVMPPDDEMLLWSTESYDVVKSEKDSLVSEQEKSRMIENEADRL